MIHIGMILLMILNDDNESNPDTSDILVIVIRRDNHWRYPKWRYSPTHSPT